MNVDLTGRVVIVTGAGGGLGRAYAIDMARRGAAVVVNDLGSEMDGAGASSTPAERVAAEIRQLGAQAVANTDSVASGAGATRIVTAALDHFGRVDALVNNAGIIRNAPLAEAGDADIEALLDVHLKGTIYVTRAALPALRASGEGRLVFTSSAAVFGNKGQSIYATAKAGVIGLMRTVALEEAAAGVRANAVMPVAFTRMAGQSNPGSGAPHSAALQEMERVFGNALEPSFVSPLVTYLASPACLETGAIFSARGARFARVFIAETPGWQGSRQSPATADDIAAHLPQIQGRRGWFEPESLFDEIGRAMQPLEA